MLMVIRYGFVADTLCHFGSYKPWKQFVKRKRFASHFNAVYAVFYTFFLRKSDTLPLSKIAKKAGCLINLER